MLSASWLWLGLVMLAGVMHIHAAVIINTLGTSGATQINKSGSATGSFDAVMFDLEGASASLDSVSMSLKSNVGTSAMIAGIFSSSLSSTAPTTFVADLGTASLSSSSFGSVTFTPLNSISLAADKRYWVVFGTTSANQAAYGQAIAPSDAIADPSITVFNAVGTIGRWRSPTQNTLDVTTLSGISLTGGSISTTAAPLFRVDGTLTAVPEPSSSLVALTLCALAAAARRFARRQPERC